MHHTNSRQVPQEECIIRVLGFSRHLIYRASDTRRGIRCPFDTGIYHHEINCNENDKEREIKAGPLGSTIPRIITSRLLKLMDYNEQIEASIKIMIAKCIQ